MHPSETFKPAREYISDILDTWKRRKIKPKFHVSEQGSGRIGHHSDFVETIPDYLLEIPKKYKQHIDIMIEAKKKEQAIIKLYEKYPDLNCRNDPNMAIPGFLWSNKQYKNCECCDPELPVKQPKKRKRVTLIIRN